MVELWRQGRTVVVDDVRTDPRLTDAEREPLLVVEGLAKNFGGVRALEALSLEVAAGELVGLIGPNGSGKTTAFNLLTGVLKPSSGRIRFHGQDVTGNRP